MSDFLSLGPAELETFLLRRRARLDFPDESRLAHNLVEILRKANEFVPSSAGSIILDDPLHKVQDRRSNELSFVAAFGESAAELLGVKIPADQGIAGRVYVTGRSYFTTEAATDEHFFPEVDEKTRYTTRSLVAIPIRIERQVCGVLELVNRSDGEPYTQPDVDLLEIFAGYLSVAIQNVLDARQASEIARRDNLTGLFNDRYLHIGLDRAVQACRESGQDLAVLFLDLDRFKMVNDTHGHLAGSQVLREIGWELRELVDHSTALAARYGGDEFVIAARGLDLDEAVALGERIRARVSTKVFIDRAGDLQTEPLHLSGLTCSIGIATIAEHLPPGLEPDQIRSSLLRLSDTAMYRAKDEGRDRICIASDRELQSPVSVPTSA